MNVIIGCEYSGVVRDAFTARGHNAWSCDLLQTERPGQHHQGDLIRFLNDTKGFWQLGIFHPTCTRICNSGVLRLYRGGQKCNGIDPAKWQEMVEACTFFKQLLDAEIDCVGVENPVPHGHAAKLIGQKYSQTIQPYNFNEDASKRTCLWLRGLSPLTDTGYFPPRMVDGRPRWGNQTDGGQNKLPPSETRGKDRAKTYQGIADAMAAQWG